MVGSEMAVLKEAREEPTLDSRSSKREEVDSTLKGRLVYLILLLGGWYWRAVKQHVV